MWGTPRANLGFREREPVAVQHPGGPRSATVAEAVTGSGQSTTVRVPEPWAAAFDAFGLASFLLRPDGTFTSSVALDELCGLAGESTLVNFTAFLEHVLVDERAAVAATLLAPVAAGSTLSLDVSLLRADGEVRRAQLRGVWRQDEHGVLLSGLVLAPLTEHISRLVDLAERYRALAEVSPDIIVVHQDGRIVYANPATLSVLRAETPNDVEGKSILDFFAPASRQKFLDRVSSMTDEGAVADFSEEQVIALDGTAIDIEATSIRTAWEGRPAFQAVARIITERKAAERKQQAQAALIDAVADAIVGWEGSDAESLRIVSWSRGAERMYGWSETEACDLKLTALLGEEDAAHWWRRLTSSGVAVDEAVHHHKDGRQFPVHLSATVLRDDWGQPTGAITVTADISQRKADESARRQLEERYTAVVAALEEGIIVIDADGRVQAANAAAQRILAVPHLDGLDLTRCSPNCIDEHGRVIGTDEWPAMVTVRTGMPQTNAVIGIVANTGQITWASINSRPLSEPPQGGPRPVVCSLTDITETRAARQRLTYAATHDNLTGLPNRAGITEFLERATAETPGGLAVLFVDLDRFKVINDSLGHLAGDRVLEITASRISDAVRDTGDTVGRLAGDEFVVICPGIGTPAAAKEVAERLLAAIKQPVTLYDAAAAEHRVMLSASIGVACLAQGATPTEVLGNADIAMYAAKEAGRSRVKVFDEPLRRQARARLEIREDLAVAWERRHFHLLYQPIVDSAHVLRGFEALLRWDHPTRGAIPPAKFIPIAEETGIVVALGEWVLDTAARAASRWRAAGLDAYVSVNLSAVQAADPNLVPMVRAALEQYRVPPSALCLEITESSVMTDAKAARRILCSLKELGVRLSIDDFGTGYSSLAYLEKFPVDALKIDRSFVSTLNGNTTPTLVAGIISLAHSLGLSVVAEGVETEAQSELLRSLQVDELQGHLFGRPIPEAAIHDLGGDPCEPGQPSSTRPDLGALTPYRRTRCALTQSSQ